MENEALTMRRLCADDLFTMMRILSKIGVNDLRSAMPTKTAVQRVREGNESAETVGVTVALTIADKLLSRLPDCKNEIYTLLADVSANARGNRCAGYGRVCRSRVRPDGERGFPRFFTRLMKRLGQTK